MHPASTDSIQYPSLSLSSEDAVVHLEYDPNDIPPCPQDGTWTRFVCISDTHSRTFKVPPGDVLLHGGDLTPTGTVDGFKQTMEWLYQLPHRHKIIIAGNHDLPLHSDWYEVNYSRWHRKKKQPLEPILNMLKGKEATSHGIVYLQNERYEFRVKEGGRTWSVYGSPWSPEFYNWAFNYAAEEAEDLISKIPSTDILLTHGPPFKVFDRTRSGEHVGCPILAKRLPQLKPRLHVFGHIHEDHGANIIDWEKTLDVITSDTDSMDWEMGSDVTLHSVDMEIENDTPRSDDVEPISAEPSLDVQQSLSESAGVTTSRKRTSVLVNAANWPAGARASRDGVRVPFAGPGFQPVIVDLRD